ncbi:DUF2878 domain-containing protein [Pseudomonas sp. TTU2014-080ASC]|uniref:DUF2878 domain-containing protein n=1 Tax=Pseudomonas sp. TTU2014-080ASC TaxID=1729724 RepID=UPI0007186D79|nr:DUF2878 domain-containing protein [Pseudomonas sp. TTU2014-080ASC]KRW59580.1 hypothetical protein AO726_12300 [Pseudomonas sp. TTU2014-080ASC]
MSPRKRLFLNAGLFQLGWLACVFGANQPAWLIVAVLCLGIHLLAVAENRREDCAVILRVAAAGWIVDSALMHAGLFDFGSRAILPIWLMLLWLLFASTLRYSMAWSARPLWLCCVLGACCGPLSYLAGARLADVGLPLGEPLSLELLALIWAVLLPALHRLAAKTPR